MGGVLSSRVQHTADVLKEEAKAAVITSKLADMKAKKTERDVTIAMRIAVLRDRVHWLLAFYATMIAVNALRTRKLGIVDKRLAIGSFEPMPFQYFPYIGTPFLFAYQADFAYGTKAERLNIEARNILTNERHWFNEPLVLPKYLELYYKTMMKESNEKLASMGEPPEKDWATFSHDLSADEILKGSTPISRLLHSVLV